MFRTCAFPWTYIESSIAGRLSRDYFKNVQAFALFVGHSCHGTELVCSLLNADQRITVGTGAPSLAYTRYGYNRNQLLWLLQNTVERPSFQPASQLPLALGDGDASKVTNQLKRFPSTLKMLKHRLQVPVSLVHVVSNPFTAISYIHARKRFSTLRAVATRFVGRCETTFRWLESDESVKVVYLDDLLTNPREQVSHLVELFGLSIAPSHIRACTRFVESERASLQKSVQTSSEWPNEVVDLVTQRLDKYRFLRRYTELQPTGLAKAA